MSGEITVQVDFFATLRKVFGHQPIRVTLPPPASVGAALEKTATNQERRSQLYDASGVFRRDLTVLKNGRNISFLGGLETELESGDTLTVFTPILGG